ncbi:NAD(P)H-quinone oxidoreductase subunit F [Geitlerinema sp. PCC 9228]|uniref:NAD(P)H-quinone oxidoreductase subunit F n=1 Tax=Geitlerinema sp. PCC 9228 TaxID=111611 RepID=UPI0008F98CF5|nr:NAD(P)H-quinone oxidoreductase subunit F [Geitlerinema sp. PCC 9228]
MAELCSQTIWLVPLYALLGAVLGLPWSPGIIRRTGPRPAGYINIITTFVALVHSVLALPATLNRPPYFFSVNWLDAAGLQIDFSVKVSVMTVAALIVIAGLNLIAQVFAIGYMEMDWGWARFYALLALFEAGISTLVLCNSLFFSYVVLEILTLGTYLLIGFWFNQSLVVTGARDAFLTKRVGDLILLMGVVAILPLAGTWDFGELAVWAENADLSPTTATLLSLALLAGPVGKCAQFPLHLWLDEAMEGPIPATILRNTIVVATGAWVLIQVEPVISLSSVGTSAAIAIGAATAIGTSLIAIAQIDVKRTLSYTTSAYMGLIFIAVGTGEINVAYILLLTYGMAMALLVACVGCILANNITQDLTQYGGLWSRRPIVGLSFLVGTASLVAVPPLGGFWALLQMASNLWQSQPLLVGVVLLVNGLTAFGMTRVFGLMFAGQPQEMTKRSPEVLWAMVLPTTIQMGFALHLPLFLLQWNLLPSWEDLNKPAIALLLLTTYMGMQLGGLIYLNPNWKKPVRLQPQFLQELLAQDLYTAKLYRFTIVSIVGIVSQLISWIDRYVVDGLVNLVGLATIFSGQSLRYNVSGQTQFYAFTIVVGVALLGLMVSWSLLSNASIVISS